MALYGVWEHAPPESLGVLRCILKPSNRFLQLAILKLIELNNVIGLTHLKKCS